MASTATFEIRAATRDDFPAVVGIYNWAVNQTFATIDSEPLDVEEAESWWDTHASCNTMLVAVDEHGVLGWGRLLPWKQRGFDAVEDLVYVDPVHHGRGIGHLLHRHPGRGDASAGRAGAPVRRVRDGAGQGPSS